MLRKSLRLRAAEVREVLRVGRTTRGRFVSLKYSPAPGPLRLAVVVTKKVAKTAVVRNRLRRAAYRALGEAASLPGTGHAILFIQAIPQKPIGPALTLDLTTLHV